MPLYLLIDTNALNNLYLDTSKDGAAHGWMLLVSSITYLFGLLIFNGVIISVLSNWIALRKENYNHGISRYHNSGHYVIMGYDDMVPSVIADIFRRNPKAQILVLSAVSSVVIREQLRKAVAREHFDQIVVNYGHRTAREYYPDIQLELAKEIYVVGKRSLPNHDAVNVECVENIFTYLDKVAKTVPSLPQRILCVFEDFDTYSAFKLADIFEKAKQLHIDFVPYNYYVGWAKQVLVARRYFSTYADVRNEYPAVYRQGIGYDDPHYVHLVFVGTSTFAVAFALEAAQLLHFPNGTDYSPNKRERHKPVKTKITFIDKNAESEMLLFRTRNRHFFDIQSCYYRDLSKKDSQEEIISPNLFEGDKADFLDVDFEFVNGDVYSKEVQQLISKWATDENQYMSIFLAHSNQRDNFCLGMNMPDTVYDNNVNVFIRQDNADTFVTELRNAHTVSDEEQAKKEDFYSIKNGSVVKTNRPQRYAHIYPFGMTNTAFYYNDMDTTRAQLYNYLYQTADYSTSHFIDKLVLASIPVEHLLLDAQQRWQNLKVALKWSNLYAVETFPCKQASLEVMRGEKKPLTEQQQTECLARVEHDRWNVEKLLMGYRKPLENEDKYSLRGDGEEFKENRKNLENNKKHHFVHPDICPFDKLDNVRILDERFVEYIPWILSLAPISAE